MKVNKQLITGLLLGLTTWLLLSACFAADSGEESADQGGSQETASEPVAETGPESSEPAAELVAGTNIAKHIVPLEEVVFDTFDGSYVPLSTAREAKVLRLRDAIPPITEPKYSDVQAANEWLEADDIVLGYVDGDEAYAYPTRILNFHEIINETINGVPVLISFCPLCDSGIVYDRRLNGQVLEFGNTSALYESDMVMYDKQTFSYWFQVGGQAIVGELAGERLENLPTLFMQWSAWRETYPDSRVLSRDTGFDRPYDRNPFASLDRRLNQGRFPFPVSDKARDDTLPAGEKVISLVIDDDARAYPVASLQGRVANDTVGGVPVAVAVNQAGVALAFDRRVDGQTLTLAWQQDTLVDNETGTRWSTTGTAISGPLEGEQLESVPARFSFWFAIVAAFPDITVY